MISDDPVLWVLVAFGGVLSRCSGQTAVQHDEGAQVTVVVMQEPSEANPVSFVLYPAQVKLLGRDKIRVGRRSICANKVAIDPSPYPELIVWSDDHGLLLAPNPQGHLTPGWGSSTTR